MYCSFPSLLPQSILFLIGIATASALFQFGPSALGLSGLAQEWWSVAWWIASPAFAALACLFAAVVSVREDRKAWRNFSMGCALWSSGTLAWQLYDLRDGVLVFPGVADAAYLLSCTFFITGMFHFCREQRATGIQVSNFVLSLCALQSLDSSCCLLTSLPLSFTRSGP